MKRSYEEVMKQIHEKWTVENITNILDEMGVDYELKQKEELTSAELHVQSSYKVENIKWSDIKTNKEEHTEMVAAYTISGIFGKNEEYQIDYHNDIPESA